MEELRTTAAPVIGQQELRKAALRNRLNSQ